MRMFHRRPTAGNQSRGSNAPAARDAAPALFRLLSDSALYRAAMSASRVPLALLDGAHAELPFVFVNPAFERLSGYAERDALGRPVSLALAAWGADASLGTLLGLMGNSNAAPAGLRIACRVRRRDATERTALAVFDPVRDDLGRITHWIVAIDEGPGAE